jgi:hypothetical protein
MQAEASEHAQHAQEYATHADDAFHAGPTPIAALEVRHLASRFDRDSSMRDCAISKTHASDARRDRAFAVRVANND